MAASKKTCGFEILFDNGKKVAVGDIKQAKRKAKFYDGEATIVKHCLVNKFREGKKTE